MVIASIHETSEFLSDVYNTEYESIEGILCIEILYFERNLMLFWYQYDHFILSMLMSRLEYLWHKCCH